MYLKINFFNLSEAIVRSEKKYSGYHSSSKRSRIASAAFTKSVVVTRQHLTQSFNFIIQYIGIEHIVILNNRRLILISI